MPMISGRIAVRETGLVAVPWQEFYKESSNGN